MEEVSFCFNFRFTGVEQPNFQKFPLFFSIVLVRRSETAREDCQTTLLIITVPSVMQKHLERLTSGIFILCSQTHSLYSDAKEAKENSKSNKKCGNCDFVKFN